MVFPKRLLATRILHFAQDEVIFECRSALSCECGSISSEVQRRRYAPGRTEVLKAAGDNLNLSLYHATVGDPDADTHPEDNVSHHMVTLRELDHLWMTIIKRYSSRDLTFDEDTLPALSSVASLLPPKQWENTSPGSGNGISSTDSSGTLLTS